MTQKSVHRKMCTVRVFVCTVPKTAPFVCTVPKAPFVCTVPKTAPSWDQIEKLIKVAEHRRYKIVCARHGASTLKKTLCSSCGAFANSK